MSFPHSRPGDFRYSSTQPPLLPQAQAPLSPLTSSTLHSRRTSFIHQLPPPTQYLASPSTDPAKWSSRQTPTQPSRPWSPPSTGRTGDVVLAPMGDYPRPSSGYWNRGGNGRVSDGYTMSMGSQQPSDNAFYRPQTAPSNHLQTAQFNTANTPAATSNTTSTAGHTGSASRSIKMAHTEVGSQSSKSRNRASRSPTRSPSPTSPASHPKQKKRRVALSCAECAKRKQRCDRR
jgi:hypothetical protein